MPQPLPSDQYSIADRIRGIVRWGLLTLVVLVIGGCVAENYRGHYLWRKYRREWEAKGERFDLELIARALERHRVITGRYPDRLEVLTPKFLARIPPDVIAGQLPKYRLTQDDRFLLYCVGWNETDETVSWD